jgi:cystathionine beta-lyase/cystathionine gamma-synthase
MFAIAKFGRYQNDCYSSSFYNTHKLSVDEISGKYYDGLVRVSVGLETVKDVIADLEQALS